MRVEDLDLKELLELDPNEGMVHFAGQRALIFDAVSHGLLRKELIDNYGERTTRGILSRYGYIHGWRLAENLKNKFKWDSDGEWRKAGTRIYALQGLLTLDPEDPLAFRPEGVTWLSSFEVEQQILLSGRSENTVCWTLSGLISGYHSFVTGRQMYALEDRCIGKGDTVCHATIKPEEEWGNIAGGELAVFKRVGIDGALRDVTSALKRMESELREKKRKLAAITKVDEDPAELMARSPEMRKLMTLAKSIAKIDSTVLITGGNGTGKERVTRFVHDHSARAYSFLGAIASAHFASPARPDKDGLLIKKGWSGKKNLGRSKSLINLPAWRPRTPFSFPSADAETPARKRAMRRGVKEPVLSASHPSPFHRNAGRFRRPLSKVCPPRAETPDAPNEP